MGGGRGNLPIPITLAVGFFNRLYYRTSRDIRSLIADVLIIMKNLVNVRLYSEDEGRHCIGHTHKSNLSVLRFNCWSSALLSVSR